MPLISIICIILGTILFLWSAFRIFRNAHRVIAATSVSHRKPAHMEDEQYPYVMRLIVDGLDGKTARQQLENALNALPGAYATVDLASHEALLHMRSELPIATLNAAVKQADCLLLTCRLTKSPEQSE